MVGTLRVLLVDDHPIVREGLRSLLETHGQVQVIAEASDGQEAVHKVIELRPDIVLMDIRMAGMDGVEATRQIKFRAPDAKVIILTSYDDDQQVFEAIRAGASGYVLKDVNPGQLLRAIQAVADGYSLMSPPIARKVQLEFQRLSWTESTGESESIPLTARESEVLGLIARGNNNREIAAALSISEKTVKTHVSNIFAKLQITDRSQAVLYAARKGMIT